MYLLSNKILNVFFITSLLFFISCKTQTNNSKLTNENNGIKPEDCPVSQVGQNDDFLKNISELSHYKWNNVTKKATVTLQNNETLIITRGGCIHFMVEAEFHPITKINTDRQVIFKRILWITKQLKDFKYQALKEAIANNRYKEFTNQYITTITFTDKILEDKFYAITINTETNTFAISQYLK
jgi:hypothetical protein